MKYRWQIEKTNYQKFHLATIFKNNFFFFNKNQNHSALKFMNIILLIFFKTPRLTIRKQINLFRRHGDD